MASAVPAENLAFASNLASDDWPYYQGDPAGTHYSPLKEINVHNVRKLKVAWVYDTKDRLDANSTIESNPLTIRGRLYLCIAEWARDQSGCGDGSGALGVQPSKSSSRRF